LDKPERLSVPSSIVAFIVALLCVVLPALFYTSGRDRRVKRFMLRRAL
jgi:hypothetical protein